ncbi:MAG: CARDB domain-containing protein, partial [Thermoanaerobaculia bacterium]
FDEAAGNFQVQNFGRGGAGGDPVFALARASGRNNAYYQHAPDGSSPTIAMFLWDGAGCWSADVDGDGTPDLDGDHDSDIVIHEYHHGVTMRLNTAWSGDEARAIGEGGGDFFAYSLNGDTVLADYSRPGGIRGINLKTYADWSCPYWFFCQEHTNGEIWANALWDLRERFRTDLVRGSEAAAIAESHQLYVDALKLSPPAPTMLDMRDAMLLADSLRNPWSPRSENFCRIWEPFAGRGMGVAASDTADNGLGDVVAAYNVPDGCEGPPPPPTVTLSVVTGTATEAGPASGLFRVSRGSAGSSSVSVGYWIAGSATNGTDYVTLSGTITIPAEAVTADIEVAPIDDTLLESNETVVLSLKSHVSYVVGSPASGTVSVVSDDAAPDFVVTALAVTKNVAPGGSATITDTTKNQGQAASSVSTTSFYLSKNTLLETSDPMLGGREVPGLTPGTESAGSATVVIPASTEPGTYTIVAKADGPLAIVETQESNNTRTTTIQIGPDLTVAALSGPQVAAPGATIAVSDTTTNAGGGPAPASATRFYLSANYALDAGDVALQARNVPALTAGAANAGSTSVTIPSSTTAGLYYLIAKADADASVPEAVETNNTRSFLLRVGADLTVASLVVPWQVASGATIVVSETTQNSGTGTAASSTTALYLSSNSTLDAADVRLSDGRAVPQLLAGATSGGNTTVTLPELAVGTWFVITRVDDGLVVPEVYEGNNTRAAAMYVGPDLTISSLTVPATGVSGGTIVVSHTVKNSGAQAAAASLIKFYLSTNASLDAADTDLRGVADVPALAGGASFAGSTTLTLPSGLSGTFYVIAVADGTKVVPETSEWNNNAPRAIKLTIPIGTP